MSNLIRNTNNLLDTVFGINDAFIDAHFNAPRPYMSRQQNGQVISKDESWQVVFAVPGVKPEEVNIKVDDNVLSVNYTNTKTDEISSFVSSFSRSFQLDKDVNVNKIDATHENGVLTVIVPKPESKKKVSRVIDVKTVKALVK
tara:strand:- start:559 stop:987 length:429 start_codon:yes stop_codon:yes gene_type:complete